MTDLRALSVRQPWASAITGRPGGGGGPKDVENRRLRTHYRGPILIHAGLRYDHERMPAPLVLSEWMRSGRAPHEWAFGVVVGVAVVKDCHRCDGSCSKWAEPGAWHWVLHDRRALSSPVPARGQLGLWIPDPDLAARIRTQLEVI